jgi:putative ABC transport system substrate-binding protein
MTGFINLEASMGGKWLELLKEVAPRLKRVALMFNPDTAPGWGSILSACVRGGGARNENRNNHLNHPQ